MKRLALTACALLAVGAALAQADNPVSITLETFLVTANGERVPATEARPGQTVEYRLTATNVSSSRVPAGIVVLNMPVLDGVGFLAASVIPDPDVRVEFFDADGRITNHGSPATKGVRDVISERRRSPGMSLISGL